MRKIKCPTHYWISFGHKYPMIFFIEVKKSPFPILWIFMKEIFTHAFYLKQTVNFRFNRLDYRS